MPPGCACCCIVLTSQLPLPTPGLIPGLSAGRELPSRGREIRPRGAGVAARTHRQFRRGVRAARPLRGCGQSAASKSESSRRGADHAASIGAISSRDLDDAMTIDIPPNCAPGSTPPGWFSATSRPTGRPGEATTHGPSLPGGAERGTSAPRSSADICPGLLGHQVGGVPGGPVLALARVGNRCGRPVRFSCSWWAASAHGSALAVLVALRLCRLAGRVRRPGGKGRRLRRRARRGRACSSRRR